MAQPQEYNVQSPSVQPSNAEPSSAQLPPSLPGSFCPWAEGDTPQLRCTHPPLPNQAVVLIDIDLNHAVPVHISVLSEDLSPQEPNSARIFLCPTSKDAKSVFATLGNKRAIDYIDKVRSSDTELLTDNFQSDVTDTLVPYDPRSLLKWMWLEPGASTTLMFPELTESYIIQSQIRLSSLEGDRFQILWFNFTDLYTSEGIHQVSPALDSINHFNLDRVEPLCVTQSTLFALSMYHPDVALCTDARSAPDFLAFLLLDILSIDATSCSRSILAHTMTKPLQDLDEPRAGNILLKRRLGHLNRCIYKMQKATGLKELARHLADTDISALLSPEKQMSFSKRVKMLKISTGFLQHELQRQKKEEEEELAWQDQAHQTHQQANLSALTYLATFFFPFSLATSMLSMQFRFKELGLRLFDFVGVGFIILTLTLFIFHAQKWFSKLHDLMGGAWYVKFQRALLYMMLLISLTAFFLPGVVDTPDRKVALATAIVISILYPTSAFLLLLGRWLEQYRIKKRREDRQM